MQSYWGHFLWIIIGSDRRREIEGKIVRFRSGRVRDGVRVRDKDRRSEPNTLLFYCARIKILTVVKLCLQVNWGRI